MLTAHPFPIEARDAHSNPTGRKGDRYIATIVGPHETSPAVRRSAGTTEPAEKPEIITCEIVDRGDGTHEVRNRWTQRGLLLALLWRYVVWRDLLWLCLPWIFLPWQCLYQVSYLIDLVGHYSMTVDDELGDEIAGSPFELVIVGGVSSAAHSVLLRRPDLTYYGSTYYDSTLLTVVLLTHYGYSTDYR